jgi:hypothetical protein
VVPLLGLGLLVFKAKEFFRRKRLPAVALAALAGGIPLMILFWSMRGEAGASRFSGVGLLADRGPFWRVNELRGQHQNPYSVFAKLIHNQYLEYSIQFLDNWWRHFGGDFLFISGDEIQRNRVPETGQFLLIQIPFMVLGFYYLLSKKRELGKGVWLILWWVAVAPVASALTFQSPHAIRSLNLVIPLTIITALGLVNFYGQLKVMFERNIFLVLGPLFMVLFVWNFAFYAHQYYVHYHQTYPAAWEDGFESLANYLSTNKERFEKIYVTNKYDQPYILLAFFLKYPPDQFQKQARLSPRDQYGFSTVERFDKFVFGPIDWPKLSQEGQIMIIGTPEEVPSSATIVKRIYFKDGKTEAFRIVEN